MNKQAKENQTTNNTKTEVVKYSTIKRMLGTLDKFLSKRLGMMLLIYAFAITLCAGGIFLNTTIAHAAAYPATPGGLPWLDSVLWAMIATMAFIAVLSIIYVLARRKKPLQ